MNFSPLCINTAYFQWIRCPDSGVSRCRRTVRPLVYSSRVSNINLDATEFTTPSSGGAAARGQRPQRDLPTFQTLRRTRAAPRSTCSGNYHDEEKTLGMILIRVCTAHGAPSFPQILHSHQMARGPRSVGPFLSEPTYT